MYKGVEILYDNIRTRQQRTFYPAEITEWCAMVRRHTPCEPMNINGQLVYIAKVKFSLEFLCCSEDKHSVKGTYQVFMTSLFLDQLHGSDEANGIRY